MTAVEVAPTRLIPVHLTSEELQEACSRVGIDADTVAALGSLGRVCFGAQGELRVEVTKSNGARVLFEYRPDESELQVALGQPYSSGFFPISSRVALSPFDPQETLKQVCNIVSRIP